jgi:hypothetical protein
MTHLDAADDRRTPLLAARAEEYRRLAGRYAGLVARCGRVGSLLAERRASGRPARERLTDGPMAG